MPGPQTIDTIFGNLTELHELAVQFQCSLEECIEMSAEADKDKERHPLAGFVFEDLAEVLPPPSCYYRLLSLPLPSKRSSRHIARMLQTTC